MADNVVVARNTDKAHRERPMCSQTVAFSHDNNLSAQLPVDPATGAIVGGRRRRAGRAVLPATSQAIVLGEHRPRPERRRPRRPSSSSRHHGSSNAVERACRPPSSPPTVPARTVAAVDALPHGRPRVQVEALARPTARAPSRVESRRPATWSSYANNTHAAPLRRRRPPRPWRSPTATTSPLQLPLDPGFQPGRPILGGVAGADRAVPRERQGRPHRRGRARSTTSSRSPSS